MKKYVLLEHPTKGQKVLKEGFSWMAFFFNWIFFLYHKCFKIALIQIVVMGASIPLFISIKKDAARTYSWNHPRVRIVEEQNDELLSASEGMYYEVLKLTVDRTTLALDESEEEFYEKKGHIFDIAEALILLLLWFICARAHFSFLLKSYLSRGYEQKFRGLANNKDHFLALTAKVSNQVDDSLVKTNAINPPPANYGSKEVKKKDKGSAYKFTLIFVLIGFIAFLFSQYEGDPEDQFIKGASFFEAQNYKEAIKCYEIAAEQGHAKSQFNLGLIYLNGDGVPKDNKVAIKWLKLAAEQGLANAQNNLGLIYINGEGVPKDNKEAIKWYKLAAEQGHANAQFTLGVIYSIDEWVPKDNKEAIKWYKLAAEQGHAEPQFNLGLIYWKGEGVPKDQMEAIKWFKLAAEQGFAQAQNNLGVIYWHGEGVPKDNKEAIKWYKLAAEQGHANAQFTLGVIYSIDEWVPKDNKEAIKWYKLAAEQGHAEPQFNLGLIYWKGEGVPKDQMEAIKWFKLAAEQGYAQAQHFIGIVYQHGIGELIDLKEAVKWYRLAAKQGNEDAIEKLRSLDTGSFKNN